MHGVGARLAVEGFVAAVGEVMGHGLVGVTQGQELPQHVLPHGGLAAPLGHDLVVVGQHVVGVVAQVQGAGVHGQDVDAVDELGVGPEPGAVHPLAAPHHADGHVGIGGGKDLVVHVEPVLLDGGLLGGVQVHAQVADVGLARGLAPQDGRGGEVHGLGAGLLVVAVAEVPVPGGPGVAGVGVVGAQEGKARVGAVPVVGVTDQHVHHAAPVILGGPGAVVAGHGGRAHDGVGRVGSGGR